MYRTHLLGTTMLVSAAMATVPVHAQDFQLTDKTFVEFEGYAAPSTSLGGDDSGFFFIGEGQGRLTHILGNGYFLGAQTRIEAKTTENDFSAAFEADQAWAFLSTPFLDVSAGITAGASTVFGFAAPSAIGRGYGVNSPEFVHSENPLLAPFAGTSSPTFFDTNFRVGVNTPITNNWIIAASWAPTVDATGNQTHQLTDVYEIAALYRFNFGNVDFGASAGTMRANVNNGTTFPAIAFNDSIQAYTLGAEAKYGGFTASGSYLTYDNLEGFDAVDFESITAGVTYQTDPWVFGVSWGRSITDLPESGTSFNVLAGDATTSIVEASATYAWLPGVDLGAAVVHTDRRDNRFGTDLSSTDTYGVLQTTFKFGEADFLAAPAQAVFGPEGKYRGYVEGEYKDSAERDIGTGNIFAPLWQDDVSLLFTDLRYQTDDANSGEYNLGLGYRQLVADSVVLGAYGFFDQRSTSNNNTFNQVTLGLEALTEDFDFRANGYLAEDDAKAIRNSAGTAVVINSQIFVRGQAERALSGFDAEVGYKLPLGFDNTEFRIFGGGYHFDASGVQSVSGPRARAEMRINDISFLGDGSRFTLGAEAQDDNLRGEQYYGVARLRIPFSSLLGGRRSNDLTPLEARMTERVQRDVDVVVGAMSGALEAAVNPATGVAYGNIAFADAVGGGSGGSASDPTDIQSAVTQAGTGGIVVVDGSAGVVNTAGTVTLATGQTLLGADAQLALPAVGVNSGAIASAQVSGSGMRPTINSTNGAVTNLQVASSSTVQNVNLTGGLSGIVADTVGGVTIDTVNVSGTNPGNVAGSAGIAILSTLNSTVSNATIGTNGGADAVGLLVNNSGTITVTDVSVGALSGATSSGVSVISSLDSSFSNIAIGDNTGTGATTGMLIDNSARIASSNVSVGDMAGATSSGVAVTNSVTASFTNVTVGNNSGTGATTGFLTNNSTGVSAAGVSIGSIAGAGATGVALVGSSGSSVSDVTLGVHSGAGGAGVFVNNGVGTTTLSNLTIGNMTGGGSIGVSVQSSVNTNVTNANIASVTGAGANNGIQYNFSSGTISGATIEQVGTDNMAGLPVGINLVDSIVTVENSIIGSATGGGVFGVDFFPVYLQVAGSNATLNNNQLIDGSGATFGETGILTTSGAFGPAVTLSGTGNTTNGIGTPCFNLGAVITGTTGLDGGTCP